ncbi:MAG TPA: hypothetical protein VIX35_08940 [Vicinamibacterales bacterium]
MNVGVGALLALACATLLAAPPPPQADLDDFMRQVLASRDENWKKLQQYILEESERVDVHGPSQMPIWGERREYSWFIRDGFFVRSPLSVNGVAISEDERRKAEDDYLRHAKARDRARGRGPGPNTAPQTSPTPPTSSTTPPTPPTSPSQPSAAPPPPADVSGLLAERRAPEFIEAAYFLRFKFDAGTYAFVGHESIDGQDVLRIEYYPTHLFSHDTGKQARARQNGTETRDEDLDAAVEQMMNKVSLVTLWVEPKAHQVVKYTFDNVNLDFLPAAWLVRVTDARAMMTMSQAFKNVWLPKNVDMVFGAMLAIGSFDVRYHLDFHDYKEATTAGRIKLGPERPQ